MNTKLVILRHGESQWNKENKFTGWVDIDLSKTGYNEAKKSGKILKDKEFIFDYGYTSVLKRAIHTLWVILDQLDQVWLPIKKSWRLNERHYGALQGLNKSNMVEKFGYLQVKQWRRSLKSIPPKLVNNNNIKNDKRYADIEPNELPDSESLADTINRILPLWKFEIFPKIQNKKQLIIVAHGNTIRALMIILKNLQNEQDIAELNIPTASPLIYEFNNNMNIVNNYSLLDDN